MFLRQDRDTIAGRLFPRRHLWNWKHWQGDEDAGTGIHFQSHGPCVAGGTEPGAKADGSHRL